VTIDDEMFGTWGNEKCIYNFSRKLKRRYSLTELKIDGRIILKCILKKQGGMI
jgi:hypothetical protein